MASIRLTKAIKESLILSVVGDKFEKERKEVNTRREQACDRLYDKYVLPLVEAIEPITPRLVINHRSVYCSDISGWSWTDSVSG